MWIPDPSQASEFSIDPRETANEDGMRISDWTTDVQSIRDFLSSRLP
ncbi:hypothetical protein [Actinokineospora globicatena]|nr:hypothetical protein [Actinokineospora globicatena]MCP2302871.1 hypothetical protein [Actinokineospora globicatena]GLW78746.1 hypothetical protein Aglo01_32280 [Actinokineospora globicatena]GLW84586.1 hypothetical protein Aglo02_22260 [Actinokineospora globicatena]